MHRESVLRLAGGRTLGCSDWGPSDAPAVVYCHGFPGHHAELDLAMDRIRQLAEPVRIVALDRPGYGSSTVQRRRTFLDWPSDVAEALDLLGVTRFSVLGASGGAPYALACAFSLGDRVSRVGIVCGTAPLAAPGMASSLAVTWAGRNRLWRRLRFLAISGVYRTRWAGQLVDQVISRMGEADRQAMARPELRTWFVRVSRRAFDRGGRGAAQEAALYRKPWGFDLAQISAPCFLWHGAKDRNIPPEAGRWMAGRLPNARFELWPDEGHYSWAATDRVIEVVETLVRV